MSFLSYVHRNGLWVSIPLFVASAITLVHLIRGVIRVVRQAHLVSVPLVEEQAVEFAETGRVALCIEGPRFTTLFAKLSYSLIGPDGTEANGRRSWFRPHSSGASKVRMELGRYEIPTPGRHKGTRARQRARWRASDRLHEAAPGKWHNAPARHRPGWYGPDRERGLLLHAPDTGQRGRVLSLVRTGGDVSACARRGAVW